LLHADFRLPSLDYGDLLRLTLHVTRDHRAVIEMFRRAVFNVYAHNRDDHGKQFGFLMDPQGLWRLAPAYDLTFSSGSGGEHATTVDGEGRNPDTARLLALARRIDLKPADADAIIDRVRGVVAGWRSYADTTGVGRNSRDRIARTIAPRRRPS
jgi:serine/threonine-protein kinase HipA